ncbi:MAG: CdvA-like protein [Candidatus Bathyarchaeia archaeon]
MSVHTEALRKYIGKPAKDTYGRYVGYVVGLSLDPMGQLNSIGVDQGEVGFLEYHSDQVMIEGENLLLIPAWKIACDKYREESSLTQKRFQALDELLKNGEIPQYVYDELYKKYKEDMSRQQETYANLVNKLKQRIADLEAQCKSLERFLGNIKVQHKTGEMSEETYKVNSENLVYGIKSAINEKKDLENALSKLAPPTEKPVEVAQTKPTILTAKPSDEDQSHKPLILRLRTSDEQNRAPV